VKLSAFVSWWLIFLATKTPGHQKKVYGRNFETSVLRNAFLETEDSSFCMLSIDLSDIIGSSLLHCDDRKK
jgi:hypothetical protein